MYSYILGLTYARLTLFSRDSLDQESLQQMIDCMKQFLLQLKPATVTQLEERYQYNWITMRPFVDGFYSYGVETAKPSNSCLHKSQPSETCTEETTVSSLATSVSIAYLLFALKVETGRTINTELLVRQDLLEYVTMLDWGLDRGWLTQCLQLQEQVKKVCDKLPVPRLSQIARARLARSAKEYSGQITS
jgi:hypothetical protein